jgi:gluconolactonase
MTTIECHCERSNLILLQVLRFAVMLEVIVTVISLGPPAALSQQSTTFPTIGEVVRFDGRINDLIPPDARIELLASGLEWSEGPLWIQEPPGGYLLFSDIPRNSVMKWQEGAGVSLFMKPSGYTGVTDYGREPGSNGLALDVAGRIIFCEHGDRRISRLEKDGGKKTLVDSYMGKRLNSPNDAVVKSNGDVYFTDPPYGLPKQYEDPRRELDFCGVFRLASTGELTLLTKEMTRPNGIAFSPDESVLYVAQSDPRNPIIKAFPVKRDGTLGTSRAYTRIRVYTYCAWGDDGSVLYITADDCLCRLKTKTKGVNPFGDPLRDWKAGQLQTCPELVERVGN